MNIENLGNKNYNTSDLFVECLEQEGVTMIFGVPGEENEDLLFAIDKSKQITFVPCRHEQGAAFIANVWGRLSGNAGVCLSTLGPGATNLITGVADANLDKAPLVAITGQGDVARLHHESHQLIDVVKLFEPITKWNESIKMPEVVPEIVRKAFKLAEAKKPGATHIELPEDIAGIQIENKIIPLKKNEKYNTIASIDSIEETVDLLKTASAPLVVVGNGAVRNDVYAELELLLKTSGLPVVSTFMGKSAVSDKLLNSLMVMGLGFKDYVMEAVEQADVVITIGYDIAEYSPDDWNPNRDKKIIHIDETPAEVYNSYIPEIELIGDIKSIIEQLYKRLTIDKFTISNIGWYIPIRDRIINDIKSYNLNAGEAFNVPGVLNIVREILPENGIVLSDVGAHKMWIARNFPTYACNSTVISNGMASMGIALPGAIAAGLLYENRPVVTMMGDGGFMMNLQELETAKRLGISFTAIVFNDNDYGLISWKQKRSHKHSVGTMLSNPDFVKLGESFGIKAYRPQSISNLKECLSNSFIEKGITLIEVPIDPSVNEELVEKLKLYWGEEIEAHVAPKIGKRKIAVVGGPANEALTKK